MNLDTGHTDGRTGGPSSPMEMVPPRKRRPLPPMPLECPNCGSPHVDEGNRECLECHIFLPDGAPTRTRRTYVRTRSQRLYLAISTTIRHQRKG